MRDVPGFRSAGHNYSIAWGRLVPRPRLDWNEIVTPWSLNTREDEVIGIFNTTRGVECYDSWVLLVQAARILSYCLIKVSWKTSLVILVSVVVSLCTFKFQKFYLWDQLWAVKFCWPTVYIWPWQFICKSVCRLNLVLFYTPGRGKSVLCM